MREILDFFYPSNLNTLLQRFELKDKIFRYDFSSGEKQENQEKQQSSTNIIPMNSRQANLINDIILSLVRFRLNKPEIENETEKLTMDAVNQQLHV